MKRLETSRTNGSKGKRSIFSRRMLWLHVDDTLPRLTAEILNRDNEGDRWEALIARDAAEILELSVSHRPQIIFLYLPTLLRNDAADLRTLCRTLKTRFVLRDIPVVGFCDSLDDYNALLIEVGAQGYLRQPFTREEFADCCQKVLRGESYFSTRA